MGRSLRRGGGRSAREAWARYMRAEGDDGRVAEALEGGGVGLVYAPGWGVFFFFFKMRVGFEVCGDVLEEELQRLVGLCELSVVCDF